MCYVSTCTHIHKYTHVKSGKVHKLISYYLRWGVDEKTGRIKINTFFTFILFDILDKACITFKIE